MHSMNYTCAYTGEHLSNIIFKWNRINMLMKKTCLLDDMFYFLCDIQDGQVNVESNRTVKKYSATNRNEDQ